MGSTTLSRSLSYVLRHGGAKMGLDMRPDGFVPLEDVLRLEQFRGVSHADVKWVVENNDKQRFSLRQFSQEDSTSEVWFIRANQGHSFGIDANELLAPIQCAEQVPVCVHGTYWRHWPSIQRSGLLKMDRSHVHFSSGLPEDRGVVSGMRRNSEIAVFVDVRKAMADGVRFFVSENGVIMSDGFGGKIAPCYFQRVVDLRTNDELSFKR